MSLGYLWNIGKSWGIPWEYHGNTMGISWEYHTDWIFDDNQMTIMIGYLWLLNNQIIS
jgi:hypothetical protein